MKRKSTIFALIGLLMFVAAMYFMHKETKESYDLGDYQEPEEEPEDPETEPEQTATSDEGKEEPASVN